MISVIILTKNEEKNIVDCIETIPEEWEVIVIDDNSKDRTVDLAKTTQRKVIVYKHPLVNNFAAQRNFGLSKVSQKWVLFLDADERLSPQLVSELELKATQTIYSGFEIRRVDHMWGKTLQYGEFKNMWLTRFGMKGAGEWRGRVHEVWEIDGRINRLKNTLDHYPHASVREFLSEINYYTTIRAQELYQKKTRVKSIDICMYPAAKFIQNYIIKMGFKDGIPGFMVATIMSLHSFLVRGKLWLLYRTK